jgi:hypothetical protein
MDLFVKAVADHESVDESEPVRLHGMILLYGVIISPDLIT